MNEIIRINTPELITTISGSNEKTISCLCCMSAPVKLSAKTDKGGFSCGETITISADHGYRRITNVHAILRGNTTYHIRQIGKSNFSYKLVAFTPVADSISCPGEKIGYLNITNTVLSTNCDALKVSYSVIVKLVFKLPNVKDLTILLPITIGNGQASFQHSAPTYPSKLSASVYPMSNALENTLESSIMPSAPLYIRSQVLCKIETELYTSVVLVPQNYLF